MNYLPTAAQLNLIETEVGKHGLGAINNNLPPPQSIPKYNNRWGYGKHTKSLGEE